MPFSQKKKKKRKKCHSCSHEKAIAELYYEVFKDLDIIHEMLSIEPDTQ